MLENQKNSCPEKFRVWIEDVETNTLLTEYEKKETREVVSCYITSIYDQLFGIHVDVNDTDECLACEIYIDGQCVRSTTFGKQNGATVCKTLNIKELDGGLGTVIPLRFGKTEMKEKGTNDQKWCDELGTIKIQIIPIKMLRLSDPGYHPYINKDLTYGIENTNPLRIHSAKFVSEPTQKRWTYCRSERINPNRPLATFIFKYRSSVSLQLKGILPRTVPAELNVNTDDVSHLTPRQQEQVTELKWIEEAVEKKKKHLAKKIPIKHEVVPNYQKPVYEDVRISRHRYQKQPVYRNPERATRMSYE